MATEQAIVALQYLEALRWPLGVRCAHCDHDHCWFLRPLSGTPGRLRRDRANMSVRRIWKCERCREQFSGYWASQGCPLPFSVMTNTIMHRSHIPADVWVAVAWETYRTGKRASARSIERRFRVTSRPACIMARTIVEAVSNEGLAGLVSDRSPSRASPCDDCPQVP